MQGFVPPNKTPSTSAWQPQLAVSVLARLLVVVLVLLGALATPATAPAHQQGAFACGQSADIPPGEADVSDNVEHLGWVPGDAGDATPGGRLVGRHFFVTGASHFTIYDVSKPESPRVVSRTTFPCRFENEDVAVSPDGNWLLYSDFATTGSLYVYDVRDKRQPRLAAELPGGGGHIATCVLACRYAINSYSVAGTEAGPNSGGRTIDLANPAEPKVLGDWTDSEVLPSRKVHDVTEIAPGILMTASQPILVIDVRKDPANPTVVARGFNEDKRYHQATWPRLGKDRFALAAFETNGTPNCSMGSGDFSVLDATQPGFPIISSHYLTNENSEASSGNPVVNGPGLGCSPHWFEVHPTWHDGGLLAMGAYDHGMKLLQVDAAGQVAEVGHFRAPGASASAAYWVTCDIVYVVDYVRGLDVVRVKDAPACSTPPPTVPGPAPCAGPTRPTVAVKGIRVRRGRVRVIGSAGEAVCGGALARVEVAVARRARSGCRFLVGRRVTAARKCRGRGAPFMRARGTKTWRLARRARVRRGRYVAFTRAVDSLGRRSPVRRISIRLR